VNTQFQMINATKKAFQTREKERQDRLASAAEL
jgi:hypothetical protein